MTTPHVGAQITFRQQVTDIPDLTGASMVLILTSPINIRTSVAATINVDNPSIVEAVVEPTVLVTPGRWRLQFQGTFSGTAIVLDENVVTIGERL